MAGPGLAGHQALAALSRPFPGPWPFSLAAQSAEGWDSGNQQQLQSGTWSTEESRSVGPPLLASTPQAP